MLSGTHVIPLQSRSFQILEATDDTSLVSLLVWRSLVFRKVLHSRILSISVDSNLTSHIIQAREATVEHDV